MSAQEAGGAPPLLGQSVAKSAAGPLHALLILAAVVEFSFQSVQRGRRTDGLAHGGGSGGGGGGRSSVTRTANYDRNPARGSFNARLQMLAGAFATGAQLLGVLRLHDPSRAREAHEFLVQVTTVLVLAPLVLIPLLAPRWYERRGTWVCLLARMAWLLNPNQRSARGIAHVIQAPPATGQLGLAKDALRLFLGARGISLLLLIVTMPLPLWLHVAMSLLAVQRMRTTADLCDSTMLRAPVWVQRISTMHQAARWLPLLLERAALPSLAGCPPEVRCRIFVAFYQYLLAAVSIPLAARLHPLLFGARSREGSSSGTSAARKVLHSSLHGADARLQHLCALLWGEQGSLLARTVAAWMLLSFLWQLALLLEVHAPLPPTLQLSGT